MPHTPNSDELFHYPNIDNTFDYESDIESVKQADSKNGKRAATSVQTREQKAMTGRTSTVKTADGSWKRKEAVPAEVLTSGKRPTPADMRIKDLGAKGRVPASVLKKSKPEIPVAARRQSIKTGQRDSSRKPPRPPMRIPVGKPEISSAGQKRVVSFENIGRICKF